MLDSVIRVGRCVGQFVDTPGMVRAMHVARQGSSGGRAEAGPTCAEKCAMSGPGASDQRHLATLHSMP